MAFKMQSSDPSYLAAQDNKHQKKNQRKASERQLNKKITWKMSIQHAIKFRSDLNVKREWPERYREKSEGNTKGKKNRKKRRNSTIMKSE